MHPKMNRKTSYNGVRNVLRWSEKYSIAWSAIGVRSEWMWEKRRRKEGGKKEEEKEREKDRGKTGKKTEFCRRSDIKNRLFGQKIAFFLHNFDKKLKNICIIAEFFVTLWSRFYGVRLHACTRTYSEKTVSKSITSRDTGRLETTRTSKKPKNK